MNLLNDKLKILVEGYIYIYRDGVQANLNKMETVISTGPVAGTNFVITNPTTNTIRVQDQWTAASFDGTITELKLSNTTYGDFSTKEGLSITKTSAQTLGVKWNLEFNIVSSV